MRCDCRQLWLERCDLPSMGSLRNQIRTLASTAPGRFQTNRLAGPFPNEEDANGKLPRLIR